MRFKPNFNLLQAKKRMYVNKASLAERRILDSYVDSEFTQHLEDFIKELEELKVFAASLDIPLTDYCKLLQLIKDDKKIEAIKLTRVITGSGLKESKDFIMSIVNSEHFPEEYKKYSNKYPELFI